MPPQLNECQELNQGLSATASKQAFIWRWPVTLTCYWCSVDTGGSRWVTHNCASSLGRAVPWQRPSCLLRSGCCRSYRELRLPGRESSPKARGHVQRTGFLCQPMAVWGFAVRGLLHFRWTPRHAAIWQGNPSWEACHHRKLLPLLLSCSLKTGSQLFARLPGSHT